MLSSSTYRVVCDSRTCINYDTASFLLQKVILWSWFSPLIWNVSRLWLVFQLQPWSQLTRRRHFPPAPTSPPRSFCVLSRLSGAAGVCTRLGSVHSCSRASKKSWPPKDSCFLSRRSAASGTTSLWLTRESKTAAGRRATPKRPGSSLM